MISKQINNERIKQILNNERQRELQRKEILDRKLDERGKYEQNLKEELVLNEHIIRSQKENQQMKELHVRAVQDKVDRMNSFFASQKQDAKLHHSKYDERKGHKIGEL